MSQRDATKKKTTTKIKNQRKNKKKQYLKRWGCLIFWHHWACPAFVCSSVSFQEWRTRPPMIQSAPSQQLNEYLGDSAELMLRLQSVARRENRNYEYVSMMALQMRCCQWWWDAWDISNTNSLSLVFFSFFSTVSARVAQKFRYRKCGPA